MREGVSVREGVSRREWEGGNGRMEWGEWGRE